MCAAVVVGKKRGRIGRSPACPWGSLAVKVAGTGNSSCMSLLVMLPYNSVERCESQARADSMPQDGKSILRDAVLNYAPEVFELISGFSRPVSGRFHQRWSLLRAAFRVAMLRLRMLRRIAIFSALKDNRSVKWFSEAEVWALEAVHRAYVHRVLSETSHKARPTSKCYNECHNPELDHSSIISLSSSVLPGCHSHAARPPPHPLTKDGKTLLHVVAVKDKHADFFKRLLEWDQERPGHRSLAHLPNSRTGATPFTTAAANSPACYDAMKQALCFDGRYLLDDGPPAHQSATCVVFFATDLGNGTTNAGSDRETGQPMRVAVKLMKVETQFN